MSVHLAGAVAGIAAVTLSGHLFACTLCVLANDSLSVPHPHALRIALATRNALDCGTISHSDREDTPAEFEASLLRLTHQLTYSSDEKSAVDVLVVDESAWYRVELNGLRSRVLRMDAEAHTPAPVRVITTVAVVHSLGRLELRVGEAMEKGLLEVERSDPAGTLTADKPQ